MKIREKDAIITFLAWHLAQIYKRQQPDMPGEAAAALFNEFEQLVVDLDTEISLDIFIQKEEQYNVDKHNKPR